MSRPVELDEHPLLRVAVIEAWVGVRDSPEPLTALLQPGAELPDGFAATREGRADTYAAIRKLLRFGGVYKPSGRGKPASEYLGGAFEKHGGLRSINNVVDVNNVVSLYSGLPISVFDAKRMTGDLRIRTGGAHEGFVFNAAGQRIDIHGLITVYELIAYGYLGMAAAGNPVKDSMWAKVRDITRSVLVVIYGSIDTPLEPAAKWYASLLTEHCGAREIKIRYLKPEEHEEDEAE